MPSATINHSDALLQTNHISRQQLDEALTPSGGTKIQSAYTKEQLLHTLHEDGILFVHSQWDIEESSLKMSQFVDQIGITNVHATHTDADTKGCDDDTTAVWDVRPMPKGSGTAARSHTDKEFTMHTDCCFEECPPRYMALYCVKEDKLGGGLSKFLDCRALAGALSAATLCELQGDFEFRVPKEFFKGQESVTGSIMSRTKGLWRYRGETVMRDKCSAAQLRALDELDAALQSDKLILTTKMPTGCMVVLDNSKWFHGRTSINDPTRWLKRVRFHPMEGPETDFVSVPAAPAVRVLRSTPSSISLCTSPNAKASAPAPMFQFMGAAKSYDRDLKALSALLAGTQCHLEVPECQRNPYPFALSEQHVDEQGRWCALAHTAICKVVNNFFNDERLVGKQMQPSQDPQMRRMLDVLRNHATSEYTNIGSWRPDMLFPADETLGRSFEVCEINARFPYNGFFSSCAKTVCAAQVSEDILPIEGLAAIPEAFDGFYNRTQPLGIVKGLEKGGGVHIFKANASSNVRWVSPEDLRVDSSTGGLRDAHGPLPQLSLELKQTELAALSPEVQASLCRMEGRTLNDMRTIVMVHDKRLLSVLSNVELMEEYLGNREDAQFLASRVVQTEVVETICPQMKQQILGEEQNAWLLKPNLAGKGFGVLLGRECTAEQWRNAVVDPAHSQWILQPVLQQARFQVAVEEGVGCAMHVVGALLNLGGKFFGPGIFRAAPVKESIVNVASGVGTVMAPVMLARDGASKISRG